MDTMPSTNLPHHLPPKEPQPEHDLRPWLGSASVVLALLALLACAYPPVVMASLPLAAVALTMGGIDVRKSYARKGPWFALAVLGCLLSVAAFVTAARLGSVARREIDESMSTRVQSLAPAKPVAPARPGAPAKPEQTPGEQRSVRNEE
jgi:hypothetical protein